MATMEEFNLIDADARLPNCVRCAIFSVSHQLICGYED